VDARHSTLTGAEPGTVLALSPQDVHGAIDLVGAARYALIAAVWAHLEPGAGRLIAEDARLPLWQSLWAGRWRQAEGLAKVQAAFAADAEAVAAGAVSRWQASRWATARRGPGRGVSVGHRRPARDVPDGTPPAALRRRRRHCDAPPAFRRGNRDAS
jgi:hypothetical protein